MLRRLCQADAQTRQDSGRERQSASDRPADVACVDSVRTRWGRRGFRKRSGCRISTASVAPSGAPGAAATVALRAAEAGCDACIGTSPAPPWPIPAYAGEWTWRVWRAGTPDAATSSFGPWAAQREWCTRSATSMVGSVRTRWVQRRAPVVRACIASSIACARVAAMIFEVRRKTQDGHVVRLKTGSATRVAGSWIVHVRFRTALPCPDLYIYIYFCRPLAFPFRALCRAALMRTVCRRVV